MRRPSPLPLSWFAALGAVLAVGGLAASPSVLSAGAGSAVRDAFSMLCHQIPSRSPHVHGAQWALCFRCVGIVGGLALGLASALLARDAIEALLARWGAGRTLVALALPAAIDWGLGVSGLWLNTPLSRVATGAVLGLGAGWLLADALLSSPSPSSHLTPST